MLRGEAPAPVDAEEEQKDAKLVSERIDDKWHKRMMSGDPLEARCVRLRVADTLEAWIEDQVVQHGEEK